jgi:hypothetical protein
MQGKWHITYGCFAVAIGAQKSIEIVTPGINYPNCVLIGVSQLET